MKDGGKESHGRGGRTDWKDVGPGRPLENDAGDRPGGVTALRAMVSDGSDMEPNDAGRADRPPRSIWVPLRMEDLSPDRIKQAESVLDRIPELPVSVHKVLQMTSDPKTNTKEVADVVASDPVLVSHILMMVNSSYYGLSRKIDNLRLAIVLLGFNEVRNIALRGGFSQILKRAGFQNGYDTSNLWTHSYLVSIGAEYFAGEDDPHLAGTLLTLGLLHDIGKFALYTIGLLMKERGVRSHPSVVPQDAHLLKKEEILFGMNHPIIGGMLARRWNLSERICSSIECHHHPSFFGMQDIPAEYLYEVSAVCIADLIVHHLDHPEIPLIIPHQRFFEQLGIEPDLDRAVTPEFAERLQRARTFIAEIW